MNVPALKDITQIGDRRQSPEIRVWIHPEQGSDYYEVFSSFAAAENFIIKTKGSERYPVVAFRGFELSLYRMQPEVATEPETIITNAWTSQEEITPLEAKMWYLDIRGLLRSIYYAVALTLTAVIVGIFVI